MWRERYRMKSINIKDPDAIKGRGNLPLKISGHEFQLGWNDHPKKKIKIDVKDRQLIYPFTLTLSNIYIPDGFMEIDLVELYDSNLTLVNEYSIAGKYMYAKEQWKLYNVHYYKEAFNRRRRIHRKLNKKALKHRGEFPLGVHMTEFDRGLKVDKSGKMHFDFDERIVWIPIALKVGKKIFEGDIMINLMELYLSELLLIDSRGDTGYYMYTTGQWQLFDIYNE